jgi:hypothetical protein
MALIIESIYRFVGNGDRNTDPDRRIPGQKTILLLNKLHPAFFVFTALAAIPAYLTGKAPKNSLKNYRVSLTR